MLSWVKLGSPGPSSKALISYPERDASEAPHKLALKVVLLVHLPQKAVCNISAKQGFPHFSSVPGSQWDGQERILVSRWFEKQGLTQIQTNLTGFDEETNCLPDGYSTHVT